MSPIRLCYGCNARLIKASNALRHHASQMDWAMQLVQTDPNEPQLEDRQDRSAAIVRSSPSGVERVQCASQGTRHPACITRVDAGLGHTTQMSPTEVVMERSRIEVKLTHAQVLRAVELGRPYGLLRSWT